MLKIVVTDPMMARHLDMLRARVNSPADWRVADFGSQELAGLVAEADIYVGFNFPAELARAARSLRLLQVSGAGVERIAFDALNGDVVVANTYHHERSIAEYVIMAMLALSRQLLPADRCLREGTWNNVWFNPALTPYRTLRDRVLGLVGFGHIGAEIARLARCFEMRIAAIKRRPEPELAAPAGLEWFGGPEALPKLLRGSDFVVVALPLTEETRGLIGAEQLAMMKPDAFLINIARGPIVDEAALYTALAEQRIAGAALDVWYNYTPAQGERLMPASRPFHELDNVIMTPHDSGITEETFRLRAEEVAENINRLLQNRSLSNVVYPKNYSRGNR